MTSDVIFRIAAYFAAVLAIFAFCTLFYAWAMLEWVWPTQWFNGSRALVTASALAIALPILWFDWRDR